MGGRKTVITLLVLVAGVAIDLSTGRGLSQNLMVLMLAIVGMYKVSNVATKMVNKSSGADNKKVTELEGNLTHVVTVLTGLQKQVESSNKRVNALLKGQQ